MTLIDICIYIMKLLMLMKNKYTFYFRIYNAKLHKAFKINNNSLIKLMKKKQLLLHFLEHLYQLLMKKTLIQIGRLIGQELMKLQKNSSHSSKCVNLVLLKEKIKKTHIHIEFCRLIWNFILYFFWIYTF